jgi:prepilin-type N-terminal cleavage/methylation domain-containing protein
MTPPGRKPLHGEDGFALIEVLVSALILAIVAAGVMALLQATTRSAAAERQHAEGYALAQEDQARLRSLRLSTLNRISETPSLSEHKYTLNGTVFTVKSEGVFINNTKRQPANCTSGETSADYVRIISKVSWGSSSNPILLTSIVSPSNGSLDPNHGTLLVTTTKTGGKTFPGIGLSGKGPGTFSGTTDSTGCANFSDLPAGQYKVTASGANLVGTDGLPPHEKEIGVSAGTTSTLTLQYDYGASFPVEFEYAAGSGVYKPTKLDSVYVQNTGGSAGSWSPTKARELNFTASPIYPFPAEDSIWAGSCQTNNPGAAGTVGRLFKAGEAMATPIKLKVPALEISVKKGTTALSNAAITITDEKCLDPSTKELLVRTYVSETSGHQSSSSTGSPEYGLPFGTYKICASAFYENTYHRKRESGVVVQSFSAPVVKTLDVTAESGSTKTCP